MRNLTVYVLFTVSIQSLCYADVTKFPAEDRKTLLDATRFQEIHATANLPSAILALCDGGGDGKLAEPGQKWNATDAITDPTLPGKRLIIAKLTKNDAEPKLVWCAVGGPFKDYAAFLDALRNGKLHDRLDNPH
ncbi:MAG: hypothetical protein DMF12_09030 [Verrucomicrobia bacterium]|nr:MAG: hypothetical protein DMF12_09030 [Verrucomicrobiota bacterium]